MNITMAMIYDALNNKFECVKGAYYNQDQPAMAVFLAKDYTRQHSFGNACFVVEEPGLASGIPAEERILVGKEFDRNSSGSIVVHSEVSHKEIREEIDQIICKYVDWSEELVSLTLHGAGLEELLDFAHGMFQNPMTIIDQNYRILSVTEDDEMDDQLWVLVQNGYDPQADIEYISTDAAAYDFAKFIEELRKKGTLFKYETTVGTKVYSCVAKATKTSLVAVNIVEKNRKVTEGDFACLKHFSQVVGSKIKAIEFTWRSTANSYEALLQDVLRGNLVDADDIKSRLSEAWIRVLPYFTVLVIDTRSGFLKYHQLCRIDDDISELLPGAKTVIFARKLYLFLNHESELNLSILSLLNEYLKKRNFVAGKSESSGIEYSLNDLVNQAQIALRVGIKCFPDKRIFDYASCQQYYLFDLCEHRSDWPRFIHPCLHQIEEHDKHSGISLMNTVKELVRNNGNRIATAQNLGIQRNTLQYRLDKIEKLCSIDLSDKTTVDHILSSIKLKQFCENSSHNPA